MYNVTNCHYTSVSDFNYFIYFIFNIIKKEVRNKLEKRKTITLTKDEVKLLLQEHIKCNRNYDQQKCESLECNVRFVCERLLLFIFE